MTSLKSRIHSLETSNRDTLTLLNTKSLAYDKFAEDLSVQHKKAIELRRELSTAEQKLQALNSASASARFREQNLQQELELTKKNNEWFETELKTKSAEYLAFRKEKSARISELQREIEEAGTTVDSLRRNETALKGRLDDLEQKYEESLTTIQQVKEEAIQSAESFRIELDSANRLAELQGSAAETAKLRVQECQVSLEKARDDAAGEISRLRVEIETEHADKEAAERRVAELELTISQLESGGATAQNPPYSPGRGVNGTGATTPMRPGTPIGAFSPRTSRVKGGLTLTQMYAEYDKMRTMLVTEQKSNQELKAALDEMVQDLESSKPEIDELRADHARLENAVVDMSNILETAGKERDEATRTARKWQGQVEGLTKEGEILRQQLRDLSVQVKVLVLEVALLKDGESEYDRDELEKIARNEIDQSTAELNATGRFISRNLTIFKDLNELQEQNVTLRRMLRELGDEMESAESRHKYATYQQDQEELKELRIRIQTYRDEIANLIAQTKSYVKERDTFRSMLMRRRQTVGDPSAFSQSVPFGSVPPIISDSPQSQDAPDYVELLRKVQAHFDTFREETATDHKALKQQVNELSRKNSQLLSDISRSNSQLGAAVQRAELLQSNFNMLKSENVELQKRYTTVLDNANRQDVKTQQVAEDLVETKGLVDSLRRESTNLKAEKDLWKNIERRLIEDNESLRNERGRLDTLNANLQNILNEREHTDSESHRRLQLTIESLESELQTTKRKLNDEIEESKRASLRREYEHEQSQKRIDDLVTSLSSVREELIATKTTRDYLQSRVDELSVDLRSAEERLQVLQYKPAPVSADTSAVDLPLDAGEINGLTREQELSIEVSELKRDLELARSELKHAKEQVEDYKAISQETEERLQSVTDTQEQYREDTDRLLLEKTTKIQDLDRRIEEFTTELSTTSTELCRIHDEKGEATRRLEEQKANFETEISRLKDDNERYITATQFHQEDLKAQAEIAQNAQQNYENELVKHAEAAKNLQTVRAEANQLRLEAVELRMQAETSKKDLSQKEESWSEVREKYERELAELHKRREEVLHQNSLLHSQLENITKQISALQKDRANVPESEESETAGSSLEGLQEVIRFLRREKEIVEVQYHLSTQEGKRLRQQLEYTTSQLDETRLKLEQQRRATANTEHNNLAHNKLMETLNELNLFRESSVTLRNQARQAESALAEKSTRLDELDRQMQPLTTRIAELENLLETKDEEMKLLQEDCDRWQQRTQTILQKYDRVDPAEMEALKEKLSSLERERHEATSARDALQAQAVTFPEQLKSAEDRVQELRLKLTEQFKARSKELTGRINTKQGELVAVVQEKAVLQEELEKTREEINVLKLRLAEKQGSPIDNSVHSESVPPTQSSPVTHTSSQTDNEKIKSLEEKVQRLEAALSEKDAQCEVKIKERSDRLKESFNSKLAEFRNSQREELEKVRAGQQQSSETAHEMPATPVKKFDGDLPDLTDSQARELVARNETIRSIVRNNVKIILAKEKEKQETQVPAGQSQEALAELEKKFNEEKEALKKTYEENQEEKVKSAVELSDKKSLAKISMLDSRFRTVQAKLETVQKAAVETPQKFVVDVWEIAKNAKAAPPLAQMPKSVSSPLPAIPAVQPPTATPVPSAPVFAPVSSPVPAAGSFFEPQQQKTALPSTPITAPVTPATPAQQEVQHEPQLQGNAQQKEQGQIQPPPQTASDRPSHSPSPFAPLQQISPATSLPNKPPLAAGVGFQTDLGAGANALRALQSGLPMARVGRGSGRGSNQPHNPFGPQTSDQQEQQPQSLSQRGSSLPRGRGRGGQGRGGQQNLQTANLPHNQGQNSPGGGRGRGGQQNIQTANLPQNQGHQGQNSPGSGRGGLNINARQFIPQGNKRTREDVETNTDAGGSGGKRIRGGGNRGS